MTILSERASDAELLRRFAHGEAAAREEAVAELVRRHLGWVYGAARRMTGDSGLAEDVAQGVFLAMSQKAGKLAGHPCVAAWLFEATRMGSSTLLRGRRREKERERVVAAEAAKREVSGGVDGELLERVDAAVGRLRDGERRVVLLHFYSGMSVEEVGVAMGMSEAAVRKRLWRAVEKLRGWLGVKGDAAGFGGLMAGVVGVRAPGRVGEGGGGAGRGCGGVAGGEGDCAAEFYEVGRVLWGGGRDVCGGGSCCGGSGAELECGGGEGGGADGGGGIGAGDAGDIGADSFV